MKKVIGSLGWPVAVMAVISLACLIYNFIFYQRLMPLMLSLKDITHIVDSMQIPAAVCFIIIFIFHLLALVYIFTLMMYVKRENFLGALVFFLSIMSALMVLGDFTLLSDMGKEHAAGLDTSGEWPILYLSQVLHLFFIIFLIVLIFITIRKLRSEKESVILRDEAVFLNAQYIGILCGLFGLASFGYLSAFSELWALKKGIFIVSLIAIIPYILIVLYWLAIKIREKTGSWYDEKQYMDMSRGSLFTLIVSMAIMTGAFITQYFVQSFEFITITWWSFYVFLVLLLFSGSILYYSKRASI